MDGILHQHGVARNGRTAAAGPLWLLFVPTPLAVSFLVVTAVKGTLWNTGVLDWIEPGYVFLIVDRIAVALIVVALPIWISERRVLRDADACSARTVSADKGYVCFTFLDRSEEIYAGEGVGFGLVRPPELAPVVLHATRKPELDKIGVCLLFHRLVIPLSGKPKKMSSRGTNR